MLRPYTSMILRVQSAHHAILYTDQYLRPYISLICLHDPDFVCRRKNITIPANNPRLMPEMSHARKDHCQTSFICGFNNLSIAD